MDKIIRNINLRVDRISRWLFDDSAKADRISLTLIYAAAVTLSVRFACSIIFGI